MIRFLLAALIAAVSVFGQNKIELLIITGNHVGSHDWRTTTAEIQKILDETGRFNVHVTENFSGATLETLKPYDVVLLNYRSPKPDNRWPAQTEQALMDWVRSGKGIVIYHFALSAFEGWEDFEKMATATWRPNNGQHSPRHDFQVTIVDPSHPIVQGMGNGFSIVDDELYNNLKTIEPEQRHVIATANDDPDLYKDKLRVLFDEDRIAPMLWIRQWGKGRVFVTALGHDVKAMQNAGFRKTLARGAEWAATGK
jgi:type 1 glutamine amidotransferase